MIVKGTYQGQPRGFYYIGSDNYQSDQLGQTVTHAQLLASAQAGGSPLSWTLVGPNTKVRLGVDRDGDGIFDQADQVAMVNVRAYLEGAYDGSAMRGDLATGLFLPITDPYGLGATASPAIMALQGLSTPVDWAVLELRDPANTTQVVASRAVLLQRSGNLMLPNGEQTITFPGTPAGNYLVALRHRNHLGVMTSGPSMLRNPETMVDLTSPGTATYGTDAQKNLAGTMVLWTGDATDDGIIRYTGSSNDRDPILAKIGGVIPTATSAGYWAEDLNLDGVVRYTGLSNDRDPILQNIGGVVPTNARVEQLP
jgi:hypothetical protein